MEKLQHLHRAWVAFHKDGNLRTTLRFGQYWHNINQPSATPADLFYEDNDRKAYEMIHQSIIAKG